MAAEGMNDSLPKIAAKYVTEIEAAEPGARAALINEFAVVVDLCERTNVLTKLEAAAGSVVAKVEGALKSAAQAAVDHVEGVLS